MIKQAPAFMFLFCMGPVCAQVAPPIQWQKTLGGVYYDYGHAAWQGSDNGYVVAGVTASSDGDVSGNHGGNDAWIVELNDTAVLQWQKALGGSSTDEAFAIQQTTDGGYVMVGETYSNDGDVSGNHGAYDVWVVKLSNTGIMQWQKALGGSASDGAGAIKQTTDGGYIVAAGTYSNDGDISGNHGGNDAWVVKLTSAGALEWQKALGGSADEAVSSVQQSTDGGYIVTGTTRSNDGDVSGNHGSVDAWVVKLSDMGIIQWQRAVGGSADDEAHAIRQTSDEGYVVAGWTESNDGDVSGNHGGRDAWIVKLDNTGVLQWQKALGGSSSDEAFAIQQTTDGGYAIAGDAGSYDGDVTGYHWGGDAWVVKLSITGSLQWQKALGGSALDGASAIQQTSDGGYMVSGGTLSNDGDVSGNHGGFDIWIVKLGPDGVGIEEQTSGSFTVSPNPTQNLLHINIPSPVPDALITLTDALGRIVLHEQMSGTTCALDLTDKPRGLYLLTLHSAQGVSSQRVVLE